MKPLAGLQRRQMLHLIALKNSNANEVRDRLNAELGKPTTDSYINAYSDGGGEFYRYEAANSAMYVTLQNQRLGGGGAALSDAELTALPEPPAWLDQPTTALPPESATTSTWTKYVKEYAKAHGKTGDVYDQGLDLLVEAVKAGNPSP